MRPGPVRAHGAADVRGHGHALVVGPPAMPQLHSSPAVAARCALFEVGLELAGVRAQQFAERLLQAADALPALLDAYMTP
jgi:hypothetical protein